MHILNCIFEQIKTSRHETNYYQQESLYWIHENRSLVFCLLPLSRQIKDHGPPQGHLACHRFSQPFFNPLFFDEESGKAVAQQRVHCLAMKGLLPRYACRTVSNNWFVFGTNPVSSPLIAAKQPISAPHPPSDNSGSTPNS